MAAGIKNTAYMNRAAVTVRGIIWGRVIFKKFITVWKVAGAVVFFIGIILVVNGDE